MFHSEPSFFQGDFFYREVVLPSIELQHDWREFYFTNDDDHLSNQPLTSLSLKFNNASGGYNFQQGHTRNFIIWRSNGQVLDLVEYSLDSTLKGNAIRLHLGRLVVPQVMFHEVVNFLGESYLVILILTYSTSTNRSSLRRLVFQHPNYLQPTFSVFHYMSLENTEELHTQESLLSDGQLVPNKCFSINEQLVVISCESGGDLCLIQLGPIHSTTYYQESVLKESTAIMEKFRGLLLPASWHAKKTNIVVDSAMIKTPIEQLLMTLTVDGTIRIWSMASHQILWKKTMLEEDFQIWQPLAIKIGHIHVQSHKKECSHRFQVVLVVGDQSETRWHYFQGIWDRINDSNHLDLIWDHVAIDRHGQYIDFDLIDSFNHEKKNSVLWAVTRTWRDQEQRTTLKYLTNRPILSNLNDPSFPSSSPSSLNRPKGVMLREDNNWREACLEPSTIQHDHDRDSIMERGGSGEEIMDSNNASHLSPIEIHFLPLIFSPRQFHLSTLIKALQLFSHGQIQLALPLKEGFQIKPMILDQVRAKIEESQANDLDSSINNSSASKHIQNRRFNTTDQHNTKKDQERVEYTVWSQFLDSCRLVQKLDHQIFGIFVIPNTDGAVVLIKQSFISLIRPLSITETLNREYRQDEYLHLKKIINYHRQIHPTPSFQGETNPSPPTEDYHPIDEDKSLKSLLYYFSKWTSQIGSLAVYQFDQRFDRSKDPIEAIMPNVEWILGSPQDQPTQTSQFQWTLSHSRPSNSFIQEMIHHRSNWKDVIVTLEKYLPFFELPFPVSSCPPAKDASPTSSIPIDSYLVNEQDLLPITQTDSNMINLEESHVPLPHPPTNMAQSLIIDIIFCTALHDEIQTRYEWSQKALGLVLILLRIKSRLDLDLESRHILMSMLPRIVTILKTMHALLSLTRNYPSLVDSMKKDHMVGSKWKTWSQSHTSSPFPLLPSIWLDCDDYLPLQKYWGFIKTNLGKIGNNGSQLWQSWYSWMMAHYDDLIQAIDPHQSTWMEKISPYSIHLEMILTRLPIQFHHSYPYLVHLLGEYYLVNHQRERSLKQFIQVGQLLQQGIDDRRLSTLIQEKWLSTSHIHSICDSLSTLYNFAVVQMLDETKNIHLAIEMANLALIHCQDQPQQEAHFQSHLFKQYLNLNQFQKAYISMINNSISIRQEECQSRLMEVMIEKGSIDALVNLPWGVLLEKGHQILLSRARRQPMDGQDRHGYDILFVLQVSKSNYRMAAIVMAEYVDRLSNQEVIEKSILEKYASTLLTLIQILKLFKSSTNSEVWIGNHSKLNLQDQPIHPILDYISGSTLSIHSLENYQRQYQLVQCHLILIQDDPSSTWLLKSTKKIGVEAIIAGLTQSGYFQRAYRLANAFNQPIEDVIEKETIQAWKSSQSKLIRNQRIQQLQKELASYDKIKREKLIHVVAKTIIKINPEIQFPIWILDQFGSREEQKPILTCSQEASTGTITEINDKSASSPEQLLAIYLDHGLIKQGCSLLLFMLKQSINELETRWHQGNTRVPISQPYHLIDRLLSDCRRKIVKRTDIRDSAIDDGDDELEMMEEKLIQLLNQYFELVRCNSNHAIEISQRGESQAKESIDAREEITRSNMEMG